VDAILANANPANAVTALHASASKQPPNIG